METPRMYRQGDVLVVAIAAIPAAAHACDRDEGLVVLAHGEATGHHHAVADDGATLLELNDARFLRVEGGAVALTHQEHETILLPPGEYRVVRQREYTPVAPRPVAD